MNLNINIKRNYKVNGKEYNSIEEMPQDIREAFEKAMASKPGFSLRLNSAEVHAKIKFNGTEYNSIDEMPQDSRHLYENVLKAAETGAVQSDIDILKAVNDMPKESEVLTDATTEEIKSTEDLKKLTSKEPSFSWRNLIISAILAALIILLYFVFHGR
jgi:hypothetical protein